MTKCVNIVIDYARHTRLSEITIRLAKTLRIVDMSQYSSEISNETCKVVGTEIEKCLYVTVYAEDMHSIYRPLY